jgi:hypothetical protein
MTKKTRIWTPAELGELHELLAAGLSQRELARYFETTRGVIAGLIWRGLDNAPAHPGAPVQTPLPESAWARWCRQHHGHRSEAAVIRARAADGRFLPRPKLAEIPLAASNGDDGRLAASGLDHVGPEIGEIGDLLRRLVRQTDGERHGEITRALRHIERELTRQGQRRNGDSETLTGLLRRVTAIERKLELIDPATPPRPTRRRPLG